MNAVTIQTIGTIAAVIITALAAPWLQARIKGKADLENTEREEWRKERRERDQDRLRELQSLKLENRTMRESHEDLEVRFAELQRIVGELEARIAEQNGHLAERDQEIVYLKTRVSELEAENRRLYREIDALRQGQH